MKRKHRQKAGDSQQQRAIKQKRDKERIEIRTETRRDRTTAGGEEREARHALFIAFLF